MDVPSEPRHPIIDFDHHSEDFAVDPHARWAELREKCPVAWSEHYGGFWVISDYEGNHEVLKNHKVFTTERSSDGGEGTTLMIPKTPGDPIGMPEEIDPPGHTPIRHMVNLVMSPGAAQDMMPRIRHWVTQVLDDVIEQGSCDLVYDVASPVPAFITLEWLGYPLEHLRLASDAFHDLLGYPPGTPQFDVAVEKRAEMMDIIREVIAQRRDNPTNDIISYFTHYELDGERFGEDIIMGLVHTLIGGGVDSTTSLTANALVHLHGDHELRSRLGKNPDLLIPATEEFLRVYPPFGTIARTAREDIELRGCPVRSGDRVLVSRYAANFDARAFEDAEVFYPERKPNRHVSFGLGPHRCSGSHLARLMFQEMMRQILARMPDYQLDESKMVRYPDRGFVHGWVTLPASYTPGARSTASVATSVPVEGS